MTIRPQEIEIASYQYDLPDDRIAKFPLSARDHSKLLLYRNSELREHVFTDLASLLPADSLLIFNNTKVIQARILFQKESGGAIEIFCLEPFLPSDYALSFQQTGSCKWLCMVGRLKKWKEEPLLKRIQIGDKEVILKAEREAVIGISHCIHFSWNDDSITFAVLLEAAGELPIPPYLNRKSEETDNQNYQTVYSKIKGSVAAPTAGLHFTPHVLSELSKKKIHCAEITLHVGAGTFKPVKSERIADHTMHTEHFVIQKQILEQLLAHQGEAIAVGTTSVRTLESIYHLGVLIHQAPTFLPHQLHVNQWQAYQQQANSLTNIEALSTILDYMDLHQLTAIQASTQILIAPGYQFQLVKGMLTNFHQPQSTLLLLVSAFVEGEWKKIYDYALTHDFRFLSYGDSSLLWAPNKEGQTDLKKTNV